MVSESLIGAVSQVGFPIVAFAMMYRLYREERENARAEREKWMESISEHTEAVRSLRRTIDGTALTDGGQEEQSATQDQ